MGFFGKLPVAGDFVARGIRPSVRRALDLWLTTHVSDLAANARHWPEGGVRAVVRLDGAPWLLVIEPGEDAVGRSYPLTACVLLNTADRTTADVWADAAWAVLLTALDTNATADALHDALAQIAPPQSGETPLAAPLVWWGCKSGGPPQERLAQLAQISSA